MFNIYYIRAYLLQYGTLGTLTLTHGISNSRALCPRAHNAPPEP